MGDAGHHKDFVIGDGITEALLQARSLAKAIAAGSERALIRWWWARDVDALPRYCWGRDEGAPGTAGLLQSLVVKKIASDPALQLRMTGLAEHTRGPYDVLPMSVILECLLASLIRGRFEVVPEFFAQGKRATKYQSMLKEWRGRLAEASAEGSDA